MIQEIFGVNENIKQVANWLAVQGYLAVAPDLFWRIEPNVALTDQSEEEWQKAFALMNAFDGDQGVKDIQAAIDHARTLDGGNGKVGTLGFCLGGRMAYLAATRSSADASIGYYGVGIQDILDEAANITKPLILHIACEDDFVPAEAQADMPGLMTIRRSLCLTMPAKTMLSPVRAACITMPRRQRWRISAALICWRPLYLKG